MGNDEAWAMPRRTMSNPSSLRAARRLCIPAGIDDLVTCSKEVILQERMTPPHKFPSWRAAPASANTAAAAANTAAAAAAAAAPRPVADVAGETEAAAAAAAAAVSEDGDSNDQVLTVDDILYYTPSEFAALRKKAAASAKVLEWQRACFPDSIASLTSTPQRIKLGEALGEALGSAAPTPAGARASSRKKYFEHSELHHKVIAVLNKVSSDAQKYAEVRNELHRLPLPSSDEQFDKVVGVFFTKAVQEPHFSDQYAQLVVELVNSPGRATGAEDQSFAVRFKKALVDRCQAEYTRSCDLLQTANRDDSEDIAECKVRLRGTLNFVAHLYMQHMLPSRVVVEILKELTYEPPSDGHIDGVIAVLKACAPQLVQAEPDWLARVMQVCRSYANDQSVPLVKRIRFLCLDAADLIEKQLPPDVPIISNEDVVDDGEYVDDGALVAVPFAADVVDRMDDYVKRARTIMADLAQTDDYERALTRVLQEPDQYAVMLGWIHRAATTPRAEKERQQLPYFMRFLVERKVFDLESARHIFREWARVAVQTREWENSLLMWKAWSQILSEDKERDGIATQDLHNYVLHNVIVSPCARLPDDIDHYVEAVLKVNHDRTWDIKIESASKAHRFRYLAHLIGCCGHERIGDVPLSTVRKVGLPIDDVEARVFVDLMERRSPWEFIRGHEHAQSLAMVQKVMGAILAAAVALQDDHLATGSMDLLQLVVDGPDRALREALIITELMGSGAIMETHMRSPAFGYQLSKALKECEVISEATMMQAHERYGRDPLAMQLIGPCVGPPFVSQPALTVGVSSSAKRDQAIPNVNRKLLR